MPLDYHQWRCWTKHLTIKNKYRETFTFKLDTRWQRSTDPHWIETNNIVEDRQRRRHRCVYTQILRYWELNNNNNNGDSQQKQMTMMIPLPNKCRYYFIQKFYAVAWTRPVRCVQFYGTATTTTKIYNTNETKICNAFNGNSNDSDNDYDEIVCDDSDRPRRSSNHGLFLSEKRKKMYFMIYTLRSLNKNDLISVCKISYCVYGWSVCPHAAPYVYSLVFRVCLRMLRVRLFRPVFHTFWLYYFDASMRMCYNECDCVMHWRCCLPCCSLLLLRRALVRYQPRRIVSAH